MSNNEANNISVRITNVRKYMIWRLDQLLEKLTRPDFTGQITLNISAKNGRPGEPREIIERYGAVEQTED
jgi:hypothetical protein